MQDIGGKKVTWIRARVSEQEKEIITEFANKQGMNMSELVRAAVRVYMGGSRDGNSCKPKDN